MKKVLSSILIISLITSLLLLGVQWNQFKTLQAMAIQERVFMSNVNMEYSNHSVKIEQKLEVKKGEEWSQFRIPENISKLQCIGENGKPCEVIREDNILLVRIKNNKKFTFSYQIPLTNISSGGAVIKSPFFNFVKPSTGVARVVLVDRQNINGDWMYGGQTLGVSKNQEVKVYTFEDQDLDGSFYVTKSPLYPIDKSEDISLFSSEKIRLFKGELAQLEDQLPYKEKFILIVNPRIKTPYYSTSLVLLPDIKGQNQLADEYLSVYLKEKWMFDAANKEQLVRLLSSLILNKDSKDKKMNMMLADFRKKFSSEQQKEWVDKLLEDHSVNITAATFDLVIHDLYDIETTYFQTNMKEHIFTPFYAVVQRDLYVNRTKIPDKLISYNNNTYINLPLLSELGFVIKEIDYNTALVTYKNNTWKLSSNKNIFIYNDEYYEIPGLALIKMGDDFMISEYWLNQIFNVKLEDKGNSIYLNL